MENNITINQDTCKKCGLCAEVCPNKIMVFSKDEGISIRESRIAICIKCGQCMAVCQSESIFIEGLSYENDFFPLPSEVADEKSFFSLLATRRSIRNFKDKPVPREILEKVVEAIKMSPPSFPPVKIELTVVQDTAIMKKGLPLMIEFYEFMVNAMKNPMMRFFIRRNAGIQKYNVIKNHVLPLMKTRLPELKSGKEDTITRGAPSMIIFHANRNEENYHTDIYLSVAFAILAIHSMGLGATVIDLIYAAVEKKKELRELLHIPQENEVVASIILGYPKIKYRRGIRRKLKGVEYI
ncbi:MAG: nitroreductase family protein [Bacteroidales bacterium]|nr:nitroreductase family protein [Bacteroidales bacterium]